MPGQIKTTTMHFYEVSGTFNIKEMHCYGHDLFWDGCNKIKNLGPEIVD